MKESRENTRLDESLLPTPAGYRKKKRTLCVGLDIAWFGGAKNDPSSHYDFLAVALLDSELYVQEVDCLRIELNNHDLDAEQTAAGLNELIKQYCVKADQIVLAVDAPLQAAFRGLPVRKSIPTKGTVKRRACETYLNCKRKIIDDASGGAKGWHPNIQPGAPLAPRVMSLLSNLSSTFELWTRENSEHQKLIIECFPAEAIWGAKRLGWFADNVRASTAKEYKKQKGKRLTATEVTALVETVLLPFGRVCKGDFWKNQVVAIVLEKILKDKSACWKVEDSYQGGKMLDDVVDTLICLATAISYTAGSAHVWQDLNFPEDGHIIGPGRMQELLAGRIGPSTPLSQGI